MNIPSSIKALPAREVPLPGESLVSLVRRTAAAMGYERPRRLLSLLANTGKIPVNANSLGPGPVLDALATLLGQTPNSLLGMSVHHFAPTLVFSDRESSPAAACDSKTVLKYFARVALPICPICLRQDSMPHERLAWSFRPLAVCLEHHCGLIARCPSCQRGLRSERRAAALCPCGRSLDDMAPRFLGTTADGLGEALNDLFARGVGCLPEMSTAALCWWTERLAAAAAKTPTWIQRTGELLDVDPAAPADSIAWLAAAEMVGRWPEAFHEFLDAFQHVPKHRHTSTGVARRFGLLLREAARLEDVGYPTPAQALRGYLLERYAGGHLSRKICLFQKSRDRNLLRDRPWITQTEATTLLKARHRAINEFVEQGILTGQIHPAGANGRSVGLVLRESVEALRRDVQRAVGVPTAARRLGLGMRAVRDLIHDGLLARAVRTHKGWHIPVSSLAAWEAIIHSAKPVKAPAAPWMSLREATRVFGPAGLTLSRLLGLIQGGRIATRLADPARLLHGLAVARHEVEAVVPEVRLGQEAVRGCPVHRLGKILFPARPVKADVLQKWIAAGLLEVRRVGRARMVSTSEIHRFRETYCLRAEALRILGIVRTTLKSWQDSSAPVSRASGLKVMSIRTPCWKSPSSAGTNSGGWRSGTSILACTFRDKQVRTPLTPRARTRWLPFAQSMQ
ncbi:MAG: TniQ family protein [Planctomycetes bacterium]|nr:TniQ family protein [Planctomycetota bacterium]